MIVDGTRSSDRAIELVLDYYAAFNRGDREAMLALLSDDVVHDINQGGREPARRPSLPSSSAWTAVTASSSRTSW